MSAFRSDEIRAEVRAAFEAAPPAVQEGLDRLRQRILTLARQDGLAVEETLKWGQPSYRVDGGSPIRIGPHARGGFAIYAHCATSLISDFATIAPDARIDGNRALRFLGPGEIDSQPIDHLIRAAFHYHRRK